MASEVELWVTPLGVGYIELKHTSIQVHGQVFSYSADGLQTNPVKVVQRPEEVESLGKTNKSIEEVAAFAYRLDSTEFSNYRVARNNCNHFANKLSNYTTGKDIPSKYLHQNWEVAKLGARIGTIGSFIFLSSFIHQSRGTMNNK